MNRVQEQTEDRRKIQIEVLMEVNQTIRSLALKRIKQEVGTKKEAWENILHKTKVEL